MLYVCVFYIHNNILSTHTYYVNKNFYFGWFDSTTITRPLLNKSIKFFKKKNLTDHKPLISSNYIIHI